MTQLLANPRALSNQRDLTVLREMRTYLLSVLDRPVINYSSLTLNGSIPDGRALRILVLDTTRLLNLKQLYFVGFFGQKKPFIPAAVRADIVRLDRHLSHDLTEHSFILSYCSLELPDRYNWANLVVFSEIEGINHWKETQHHKHASGQLSPLYFDNVRIHMGTLEGGLDAPFVVGRTNFYDFQNSPVAHVPLQLD